MSEGLPFLINDADNHFVEPLDVYERYIEPSWKHTAVRWVRADHGEWIQLFAGRPSKTRLSRESAPENEAELERLAASMAPASGPDAMAPGDGGARAPGMFLNRMNPYKGRSVAERKALLAKFMAQREAWGSRDLR